MGIANPQGKVVEHFLTADCKSAGTPDGRLSDWESARASRSCDCFRMKYKERGWGLQIPRGKWSNIFWQRIANPLERLAGDFLIENLPERLAGDFQIENQPERLAGDFQIENQPERLAGDFQIENQPERLAEDFLIVRWTNNATQKRAVFWFKSTITTI